MKQPSVRGRQIRHFLVMEILERAQALESTGEDVVHLEVGEPDFPTPPDAVKAAISALDSGRTHYTHSLGIRPLRERIAASLSERTGADVAGDRVVVTLGSSAALLLTFAALLDPGDEVIVSDPGYACYPNIARALGAVPVGVGVGTETGFAYDPDEVRRHVGPRTKAIVVNSPSNPTGVLTPRSVLETLTDIGPALVSDEIYHGLVYEGCATSALELDVGSFVVGGFSKQYAMTGWRLGFLVGPPAYARAIQALQQNLFISASDFGQWAALAALDAIDETEQMRKRFDERRRFLLDALPTIGLPVPVRPQGAFYVFADASRHTDDSMALALDILERAKVAVAPGIDFGPRGEGYLRFSYATSLDRLQEGVRRLAAYFGTR